MSHQEKRRVFGAACKGAVYLSALLTVGLLAGLLGYILARGLPHVTWRLLSTGPSAIRDTIGVLPNILNTLYIILFTLLAAPRPRPGAARSPWTAG